MRSPAIQDVKMLIPGLPDTAQTDAMITAALNASYTYVSSKLAKITDIARDIPLGTTAILYYACSDLMTAVMSSNNELGETKISAWYRGKGDEIMTSLLQGSAIVLDDAGKPIDASPVASSGSLSLLTY